MLQFTLITPNLYPTAANLTCLTKVSSPESLGFMQTVTPQIRCENYVRGAAVSDTQQVAVVPSCNNSSSLLMSPSDCLIHSAPAAFLHMMWQGDRGQPACMGTFVG